MNRQQNNFTTPEQSKRLLKLRLPPESADCYNTTKHIGKIPDGATYKDVWQMSIWRDEDGNHIEMYPCWSVGRLIELYMKAKGLDFMYFRIMSDADMIDSIVRMFVENQNEIDFSKLEE